MNGRQISVLTGLAVALLCISACKPKISPGLGQGPGAGHHYGRQDPRVFEVYIYADPSQTGKCLADWPVGTLWQGRHQSVKWFSDDGGEYTVDFTQGNHQGGSKSPFTALTFHVPSNGSVVSNDLVTTATGYYDFAIRFGDANGSVCKDPSDPGVIIRP